MNAAPFPGNGIREAQNRDLADMAGIGITHDDLTADIAEDLARELPTQTLIAGNRALFERHIADQRASKAKQQAIASAAMAKARQLTVSIRSLEDALDSLLASEA